jgi:hypothetical protein
MLAGWKKIDKAGIKHFESRIKEAFWKNKVRA